jgi:hypothetical protein
VPIPTPARSVPPAAAARPFFAGVRSDPYAALLELFVAIPLFSYGVFELGEAVRTTKFVLNDPRPYLVSDARIVFDRHAFAAVHYLPALVLVALALFVRRRDPYTRPLVVALFALALGSAHVNAVMSFYGAALGPIGVLAIALALRPNSASSLVATIFATLLFPFAAVQLDGTLRHVLLSYARGIATPIDGRAVAVASLAWLAGAALVGAALTFRNGAPGRAIRLRLVVMAAWGLPVCAGTYALLRRFGLVLDA